MRNHFLFDPVDVAVDAIEDIDPGGRDLHIEIGFGKDIRILREAGKDPEGLFLGIEISRKKARKFCEKAARAGLTNVRCYQGDVRPVLLEALRDGSVASFTILFPDPWPKRKHNKHRWIQEPTAAAIERTLRPGGLVIAATDSDDYMAQIKRVFLGAGLVLSYESDVVPEEDRSLFAERFQRIGETVTYTRWHKRAT